jgi:transcriptional regulator with XRE-family HTH domain
MGKVSKLKLACLATGENQWEIAKKAGLSESRLSRLANGRYPPTEEEARRLATVLGKSPDELFDPERRLSPAEKRREKLEHPKPRGVAARGSSMDSRDKLYGLQQLVERIRDILWPDGDISEDWGVDTLMDLGEVLKEAGFGPESDS